MSLLKDLFNKETWTSEGAAGAALGTGAGIIGGLANNVISGGLSSDAGNAVGHVGSTIGSVIGAVNPVAGAIVNAGSQVLGGLVNRAFGTSVNQAKLNAANEGINAYTNFLSKATSFDNVQGPIAQAAISDPYRGGWFSSGRAKRKNEELRWRMGQAKQFAFNSVENNINNLANDQLSNSLANYAAFGGPLDYIPIAGAIDYELAQKRLQIMGDKNKDKGISPVYAFGGALPSNGADWTNGIIVVGNGGTHEQNPFEGVQMGIAPDGVPNLVEEGEVVWKDYVFSKRIKVPEKVKEKYKLKGEDLTFADAANYIQKSSAERPNDPIARRTLDVNLGGLMSEQEAIRQRKEAKKRERLFAQGGNIHIKPSKRGTFTAAASKHGMGVQEFASKVLANKEDYSPAMVKKANFARNASKWKHAEGGPLGYRYDGLEPYYNGLWKGSYNTEGVPVDSNGVPIYVMPLENTTPTSIDWGNVWGNTAITPAGNKKIQPAPYKGSKLTALRYVPALGAAVGATTDLLGLTNKADYTAPSKIEAAVEGLNETIGPKVTPMFIGNYLRYNPFDRLFYSNQLAGQAAGTRRAILNSGANSGQAMAGLLAADYNAQIQLGNLFRQAEEYNMAQRHKVADFNRATNIFNSEADLKAQIANRENRVKQAGLALEGLTKAAALRDAIDSRTGAARSANLTNLFDSLGAIGEDELNRQDARWLAPLIYGAGADRAPSLRGLWGANGGKINKRKKGLTYG